VHKSTSAVVQSSIRATVPSGPYRLRVWCAPCGVNVASALRLLPRRQRLAELHDIRTKRCHLAKQTVSRYLGPFSHSMHDHNAQNETAEVLDEAIDWDELLQLAATYDNGTEPIEPQLVRASDRAS
jgi:hypothetical protein